MYLEIIRVGTDKNSIFQILPVSGIDEANEIVKVIKKYNNVKDWQFKLGEYGRILKADPPISVDVTKTKTAVKREIITIGWD